MPGILLSLAGRLLSSWLVALFILVLALNARELRAQAPAVSGLLIQSAPSFPAPGPRIILDGPQPKGPSPVYYLDGQRLGATKLTNINPDDIVNVDLLKDNAIARQLGPDEARLGVIFITTKAGQHTHRVRAFNRRLVRLKQAETSITSGLVAP